jgi:hypothetical protein
LHHACLSYFIQERFFKMPSQLLEKLRRFLDQGSGPVGTNPAGSTHPLDMVMRHQNDPRVDVPIAPTPNPAKPGEPALNHTPHWMTGGWGDKMAKNTVATRGPSNVSGVNTISIHETSGWPSYMGATNMANQFLCISAENEWIAATATTPAHWVTSDKRAEGPQYYVDANGTVFAIIGDFDLGDEPRITWHTETVNATSIGIENADVGDFPGLRPQDAANGRYWFRLQVPTAAQPDDMPGLAAFALLHPANAQAELSLIWFATQARGAAIPNYPGSGDTNNIATRYSNWNNMIFAERDYRSLVLLCRLLTEHYGVPRNFCILPYSKVDADGGNTDILRKLILADERQDMFAHKCGMAVTDIQNKTAAYTGQNSRTLWYRFFGVKPASPKPSAELPSYRGFIGHALVGTHPCPGPLFDWHRFSREVWDWWWYPFDLNIYAPALVSPRRQYMLARGDTLLQEYYYDAAEVGTDFTTIGARFNELGVTDLDQSNGVNNFAIPSPTPVYSVANGVLVAARLGTATDAANPPFVLVRHEVFYQADATTFAIDYDHVPSIAWSLITHLDCSGFNYTQVTTDNPDWLNRLLMRLKESELAVAYKSAHPGDNANSAQYQGNPTQFAYDQRFQQAWNRVPTSAGPRNSTGDEIQADATEYQRIVTALQTSEVVLFPLEKSPSITPVRVILGDFLGTCGTLPNNASGVQVQIFSKDTLPVASQDPDQPGSGPVSTEAQALVWASQPWWTDISAANRNEATPDKDLPTDGAVYSYPVTDFLDWINNITWQSEWRKYEVVDATGTAVATPARPRTRLGV